MQLSPDQAVIWSWGLVSLNATILYTWVVMLLLVGGSWLITRRVSAGVPVRRGQNLLEVLVGAVVGQVRDVSRQDPTPFVPFVGTLFLFIAVSNMLAVVPGFQPPTGSLSTTAALAGCVLVAVPVYAIRRHGLRAYLGNYIKPSPLMLPFNIIGELSRTLALAVRLYGNVMSGTMIVAILLSIAPLFFPILIQALGLLTGLIQAYIFAVLAMVYIASAMQVFGDRPHEKAAIGQNAASEES